MIIIIDLSTLLICIILVILLLLFIMVILIFLNLLFLLHFLLSKLIQLILQFLQIFLEFFIMLLDFGYMRSVLILKLLALIFPSFIYISIRIFFSPLNLVVVHVLLKAFLPTWHKINFPNHVIWDATQIEKHDDEI